MTYKKTWLSYLLWAVYTCMAGVMLANYAILFWQMEIDRRLGFWTAVFVFAVFAFLSLCYVLIRKTVRHFAQKEKPCGTDNGCDGNKRYILRTAGEGITVILIFAGALICRILAYLQYDMNTVTLTQYYKQATVRAGEGVETMTHGASYLYTLCLSAVFSFLGNKAAVAVGLQILIQMLTILFCFFVIRKLAGSIPAFLVMAVFSFSGSYREHIFDMTPQDFFFLLYLLGLLIAGSYVKVYCRRTFGVWGMILGAAFTGICVGTLVYLDAISLTLLLILGGLFTGIAEAKEAAPFSFKISAAFFILIIASGGLTLMGLFAADAGYSRIAVGEAANAWYNLYRNHLALDFVFFHTEYSMIGCFLLVFLAALLIPAFWNRRKTQNATPWICLLLLLAPTPLTAAGVLSYQTYSLFVWSVLAGIGLQQCFVWEPALQRKRTAEEPLLAVEGIPIVMSAAVEESVAPEPVPAAENVVWASESVSAEANPAPKPRFIENPLPLPKKHERREMGYQYDVAEDMMKYDVEIDENDDFDHP